MFAWLFLTLSILTNENAPNHPKTFLLPLRVLVGFLLFDKDFLLEKTFGVMKKIY